MTRGRDGRAVDKAHARFELWVRDHAAELFGFAYRACGDREIAEDLVQETFYEAWKSEGRLRHEERARAWLFQILRHRYARWRRVEKRGPFRVSIDATDLEIVSADSESTAEEHDALQSALDGLSDRLKLPLLMVLIQGMTCQKAADALDLPLGTVLSRIHRAKKQLRNAIDGVVQESTTGDSTSHPRFQIGGEP